MSSVNITMVREEIRNSVGGNVIFVESINISSDTINNLAQRYFGRGDLHIVVDQPIHVANIKSALSDEHIFSLTFYKVCEEGIDDKNPITKNFLISVDVGTDEFGEQRIVYNCTELDGELRAGSSEIRTHELKKAEEVKKAQETFETKKAEEQSKTGIFLG